MSISLTRGAAISMLVLSGALGMAAQTPALAERDDNGTDITAVMADVKAQIEAIDVEALTLAAHAEALRRVADDMQLVKIDHAKLKAQVEASVREGLAAGAVGMESGADAMLSGADEMEDYADKLGDSAFRRSEVERINREEGGRWKDGERQSITEQDLIDLIPKMREGAVGMREGAVKMRRSAAKMRAGRSD